VSSSILNEIDVSGSVLFLGSGFSAEAHNIRNKMVPTGAGLRKELAKLLGLDPERYDLKTLASEVASRAELNLFQELYELFTIKKLQDYQSDLLRWPWLRIYTTNYDDAVELAYHEHHNDAPSFSYDDQKPRKLPNGSVIHLHGSIRAATEDNVLQQLILDEPAYVRQFFQKSTWYDDFIRDLRFCSACFFVGYSLADYLSQRC
jgi:NAD-dependent SIR2 family protein deacetylase